MVNIDIQEDQVKASMAWLKACITPIKSINKKFGSYKMKDVVEHSSFGKTCHGYVSEPSFIEAAKRLGYNRRGSYFNMSFKKVETDPELYQSFYGGALKPKNSSGRIKWPKAKGWKKS